jgi:hypothetical protein
MSKRKRQSKKKLKGKARINDAKKWLSKYRPSDFISSYCKRYGVNSGVAEEELMELGFYDELYIQHYEREGIDWEYRVEPLSGEMVVVPKDIEDHEIYEIHGLF